MLKKSVALYKKECTITQKHVCQKCNTDVEYELSANFIVFCPHCRSYVFLECEYGYGPVVPCNILLGTKKIAEVVKCDTYDQRKYALQSEHFGIHIVLQHEYLDALVEAKDIITESLKE